MFAAAADSMRTYNEYKALTNSQREGMGRNIFIQVASVPLLVLFH